MYYIFMIWVGIRDIAMILNELIKIFKWRKLQRIDIFQFLSNFVFVSI